MRQWKERFAIFKCFEFFYNFVCLFVFCSRLWREIYRQDLRVFENLAKAGVRDRGSMASWLRDIGMGIYVYIYISGWMKNSSPCFNDWRVMNCDTQTVLIFIPLSLPLSFSLNSRFSSQRLKRGKLLLFVRSFDTFLEFQREYVFLWFKAMTLLLSLTTQTSVISPPRTSFPQDRTQKVITIHEITWYFFGISGRLCFLMANGYGHSYIYR